MIFSSQSFHQNLRAIGASGQRNVFPELVAAYNASNRHYHNQAHIEACLQLWHEYRHLAEHPAEVALAIYFHDAVYSSRRYDNEEKSAAWARDYLASEGVAEASIQRIEGLIMATKDHYPQSRDEKLMVDIDLSILGADHANYRAYDAAVRQEYLWAADNFYREGRARVIRHFLERDYLYHLRPFRERFEAKARANMQTFIDRQEASQPLENEHKADR